MSDHKYISIAKNLLEEGHIEESLEVLKASTSTYKQAKSTFVSPSKVPTGRNLLKLYEFLSDYVFSPVWLKSPYVRDTPTPRELGGVDISGFFNDCDSFLYNKDIYSEEELRNLEQRLRDDAPAVAKATKKFVNWDNQEYEKVKNATIDILQNNGGEISYRDFYKLIRKVKPQRNENDYLDRMAYEDIITQTGSYFYLKESLKNATYIKEAYDYGPWESPKILDEGSSFNDLLTPILWHLVVVEGRTIELPKGYTLLPSPQGSELRLQIGRSLKQMRSPKDPQAYQITDRIANLLKDDFRPMLKKGVLLWDRNQNKVVMINKSFGKKLLKTVKRYRPDLLEGFTFDRVASMNEARIALKSSFIPIDSTDSTELKEILTSKLMHLKRQKPFVKFGKVLFKYLDPIAPFLVEAHKNVRKPIFTVTDREALIKALNKSKDWLRFDVKGAVAYVTKKEVKENVIGRQDLVLTIVLAKNAAKPYAKIFLAHLNALHDKVITIGFNFFHTLLEQNEKERKVFNWQINIEEEYADYNIVYVTMGVDIIAEHADGDFKGSAPELAQEILKLIKAEGKNRFNKYKKNTSYEIFKDKYYKVEISFMTNDLNRLHARDKRALKALESDPEYDITVTAY